MDSITYPINSFDPSDQNPEQLQKVNSRDLPERRRRLLVRWESLQSERSKQLGRWRELTDYIMPERGRFVGSDINKPTNTDKIMNSTPTRMARALSAGLMSGISSPARPWVNVTVPYKEAAKKQHARVFLWALNDLLRQVFELSGLYKALAMGIYPDLAVYGLGAMLMEEDVQKVIRFIPLALGTYAIAQDAHGSIDTIMYEEPWTVGELVKEFGWKKVSPAVRSSWNGNYLDAHVSVLRIICPNEEFCPGMIGKKGMKFSSAWMEIGGMPSGAGAINASSREGQIGFLREEGYREFPAMVARWATTSRDVYPTGPGHEALPDARQIMQLEKRSLLAVSKGVNPATMFPASMRGNKLSVLPGDPVYVDPGQEDMIKPVFVPDIRWGDFAEKKISQAEDRVGQAFFAPLLAAFTQKNSDDGVQPKTAAEIAAIHGEIMLQLGPVLENTNDFFSKLVDRALAIMGRRGLIPPAPPELRGMGFKAEFISVLAQAQKLVGTTAKERFLQFAGQLTQLKSIEGPSAGAEISDKIDYDKMIDGYADDVGLPPNVLLDDGVVTQKRAARAQQAQAAQQGQAMLAASEGAKNLGDANAGGDSLLGKMLGPVAGAEAGGGA